MSQIIFGIIISVVVIYFIYDWIRDSIGSMKSQIIKNNEELEKLKEKFKYKEDFHKLDKRVSILEKMGKKGAVDPRIIIIIIMIILMFLYLKSQGLF